MVSLISLLVSAALPVVNVFLMCLVGFALARKVNPASPSLQGRLAAGALVLHAKVMHLLSK